MKLYSAPLSLYARKVEIALREKQIQFERVMVPFTQEVGYQPKNPMVMAFNPKGQVPVLQDGELTLYDSTVILEYLEDAYPKPTLMPKTPVERARCRQLELFADEVMIVPLRALMHRTGPRPSDGTLWNEWEQKASLAQDIIAAQFVMLENVLVANKGFCEFTSTADISIFMMVLYSQRLGGSPLRQTQHLKAWFKELLRRPAFRTITDEIRQADLELSQPVSGAYDDLD
jgi:glutathione S-transferase